MKYKISKYFAKEVHKIKDRKILAKIRNCIEAIEKATDLADIPNLEPRSIVSCQSKIF